jgi:hypothetical protein
VGLGRGALGLVSTVELLETKSSGSDLENRDYGRKDPRADHAIPLHAQMLPLTSPTSDGLSVGIVRSLTNGLKTVAYGNSGPSPTNAPAHTWDGTRRIRRNEDSSFRTTRILTLDDGHLAENCSGKLLKKFKVLE